MNFWGRDLFFKVTRGHWRFVDKIPRKPLGLGLPKSSTGIFRTISLTYQILGVSTSFWRSPGVNVFEIWACGQILIKQLGLGWPITISMEIVGSYSIWGYMSLLIIMDHFMQKMGCWFTSRLYYIVYTSRP